MTRERLSKGELPVDKVRGIALLTGRQMNNIVGKSSVAPTL